MFPTRTASRGRTARRSGGERNAPLGRHAEMQALGEALAQARDGLGSVRLVVGPSGVGKSMLLDHTAGMAEEMGFEVRRASSLEEWTAPFFVLDQLLPPEEAGRDAAVATRSSPPSLLALGASSEEERDGTVQEPDLPAGRREGGEERLRPWLPLGLAASLRMQPPMPEATALLGYLRRLEGASCRGPQILLVDDLQACDLASLQGLRFLLRNVLHRPVVLVAAGRMEAGGRGEGSDRDAALAALFEEAGRLGRGSVLRLPPLLPATCHRLAERVLDGPLATPVDARPFRALLRRTGGNPLVLVETLRQLQREGLLRRARGRWSLAVPTGWEAGAVGPEASSTPIPPGLARVVLSRLAGLAEGTREAVQVASLLGYRFELSPLAGALGVPEEELRRTLLGLAEPGGLLEHLEGPGDRFAFAHAILWEAVVGALPSDRRSGWAHRLAVWMAEHRPGEVTLLARLYRQAGRGKEALLWTRRAIELSIAGQDPEGVERLLATLEELQRANRVAPADGVAERLGAVQRLARSIGAHPVVRRVLGELLAASPPGPVRWEVEERLAWVEAVRAPREGRVILERLGQEMRADPGSPAPAELRGRIALTWTNLLIREGDVPQAIEHAREALELLRPADRSARWDLGRAHYCLGWCYGFQEQQLPAREALAQALSIARELHDARLLGLSLELKAMLANLRGAKQEARATTLEALDQYRRAGSIHNVVTTLGNLASVEADLGEVALAWERTEEMHGLARRFDLKRGSALASVRQGDILAMAGRPHEARGLYTEALATYRELGDRESTATCLLKLARSQAGTGAADAALRLVGEVERGAHGSISPADRYLAAWARAVARASKGDLPGAREEYVEARRAAHAARNPFSEAEATWAQAEWEERARLPDRTGRALRAAAEQLFRACGVDPERLDGARGWTGPAPAVRTGPGRGAGRGPRAPRGRGKAPLAQRILLHLAGHAPTVPVEGATDRAPPALTQEGISRSLGLPQPRFAKTLSRLIERGLVVAESRPVEGRGRRLKVYEVTPTGRALARDETEGR